VLKLKTHSNEMGTENYVYKGVVENCYAKEMHRPFKPRDTDMDPLVLVDLLD